MKSERSKVCKKGDIIEVDLTECRNVNEDSNLEGAYGDLMKLTFTNDAAVLDYLKKRNTIK